MADNAGTVQREHFGSRIGAVLTAAGSAVGLGNIWGFPYMTGQNGGGAFVILYVLAVLLVGVPLMIAEFVIGNHGKKNVIGSMAAITPTSPLRHGGWIGVGAAFFVLGFYGVVAGWSLSSFFRALVGGYGGLGADEIGGAFGAFIGGYAPVGWHFLFMAGTATIVIAGLKRGIERFAKMMLPLLFGILALLAIYGTVALDGAGAGWAFLFRPDWGAVTWKTIAIAIGAAFFSLGVGIGVMVTLGSYMGADSDLGKTAVQVSLTDTLVAVVAGIAIFPAVFALGFEPTGSSGLAFVTVPAVLQLFPGGAVVSYLFTLLFFLLLSVAALTSSVTTLELVVAYFTEERGTDRKRTSIAVSGVMFLIGIPCALSVGAVPALNIAGIPFVWFLVEFLEAFILPLGGIVFTVYVGWAMKKEDVRATLSRDGVAPWYFAPLYGMIKFVIPVAVFVVLIYTANEYFFHMTG
ncbi:MAG: sodium-dependent transporter [Spirochaeta sp.]|jgi:NSS family neurotransmitter:Na+ symporter|nr:sodium-dependent transporter [Spirochaeta sp.]